MGYLSSHPKKSLVALFISQSIICSAVYAAGFQINEISPSLQGDATAGAAAANDDVTSLYINPATLATLTEDQAYLGGSEILPSIGMSNAKATHTVNIPGIPPSSITAPVQGTNSKSNISPAVFVPSGYVGKRLNSDFVLGIGMLAPYGLRTIYKPDSVVRFAALYSSVQTFDINPALTYIYNEHWSFGAGLVVQNMIASFSNFDGAYTGIPPIDAIIAADFPTNLKGSGWGLGATAGALFKLDELTRIGLGFRSRISNQLRGYGSQYVLPGSVVPAPNPSFLFNAATLVTAGVTTPSILTLSAARDILNWTLKASVQVNFWSVFNQLSINMPYAFAVSSTFPTNWKDSWFGALGAEYRYSPSWTFRGGVAFDQTPTQNAFRDPRIPDANRVWLTAGITYKLGKNLSVDGAYEHIFMQSQTVNVVQAFGVSATSTVPLEVNQVYANYNGCANILAIGLRYSFN